MPGHSLPALVAYPEPGCDNVEPFPEPGFNRTNNFCPGKDETLEFLEAILDETLDLFPSKFIHIGADEVWKGFWQKCPKCQERIRTEGLAVNNGHSPEENLQSWLVRRVESYLWRKEEGSSDGMKSSKAGSRLGRPLCRGAGLPEGSRLRRRGKTL